MTKKMKKERKKQVCCRISDGEAGVFVSAGKNFCWVVFTRQTRKSDGKLSAFSFILNVEVLPADEQRGRKLASDRSHDGFDSLAWNYI